MCNNIFVWILNHTGKIVGGLCFLFFNGKLKPTEEKWRDGLNTKQYERVRREQRPTSLLTEENLHVLHVGNDQQIWDMILLPHHTLMWYDKWDLGYGLYNFPYHCDCKVKWFFCMLLQTFPFVCHLVSIYSWKSC